MSRQETDFRFAGEAGPATPETDNRPLAWTRCLVALAIAVATLMAYRGVELNSFHFDDWPNIVDNASVHMTRLGLDGLVEAARGSFLSRRPVASVSFALDWWRGGGAPSAFLVTNLGLHILAAWTVLALLLRTAATAKEATGTRTALACGLATLWWAAQPVHVQAVSYAVQRMTVLATLFAVLGVWAYIKARGASRGTALWSLLSLASFAIGALSKEIAWIAPLLVLMAEFLVVRHGTSLIRSHGDRLLLALPAVAVITVVADITFNGPFSQWALAGYRTRDFTLVERLLTQPGVVLFHLSQVLWPLPGRFSLEHDIEIVRSAASPDFWLPLAAILAWSLAGAWCAARRESRIAGFFMLWIPATLLIESSVIPLELAFEHRMYLPSVGVAGLLALGLTATRGMHRIGRLLIWALATCATALSLWSTAERIPQWRTEASLYEQAVRVAPNSARAWNHLGLAHLNQRRGEFLDQQRYQRALYAFDQAIRLKPAYAAPWTNRGVARYVNGDIAGAQGDLEKAISVSSREAPAQHYLGEIYLAQGRDAEARTALRRACALGVSTDCRR